MHPYVGVVLRYGRGDLLLRFPRCAISQAEFSRAALPVLKRLGRVALIDPRKPLPDWLRDRERKLAKRGGMLPIWMPTEDLHIFEVWQSVVPEIRNKRLVGLAKGVRENSWSEHQSYEQDIPWRNQYSSARMSVKTRVVEAGSAGFSDPASIERS
jgi:hypothetical protein